MAAGMIVVWMGCVGGQPPQAPVETRPRFVGVASTVPEALARIDALDEKLRAVISLDERAAPAPGTEGGALYGVPVLVKDNVDVLGFPTTAGSLALEDHRPEQDALVVARLREAGAVLLGKANLSEWANMRSLSSSSGWSATGGQSRNPHVLDRSPCGSSSGSAVAVAAGYVPFAVGTETDGSILCPASVTGLVGIKPTLGLLSADGIVPIAHSQDTAGPIARTVQDAARALEVMAGKSYTGGLRPDALAGARLGAVRGVSPFSPKVMARFDQAVADLGELGATVVELELELPETAYDDELELLLHEFGPDMARYLETVDGALGLRQIQDVVAFNEAHPEELRYFGQELLEQSAAHPADCAEYEPARQRLASVGARIDAALADHQLSALIMPTAGPAWPIDLVNGDHYTGGTSTLTAVSGYPAITVPMGQVDGLPVGLSFAGPRLGEGPLLALAYAYEQGTHHVRDPAFLETLP
jgi:amidase